MSLDQIVVEARAFIAEHLSSLDVATIACLDQAIHGPGRRRFSVGARRRVVPLAKRAAGSLSWIEPLTADMIVLDVACGTAHASDPSRRSCDSQSFARRAMGPVVHRAYRRSVTVNAMSGGRRPTGVGNGRGV
jgi:hypothetical protein